MHLRLDISTCHPIRARTRCTPFLARPIPEFQQHAALKSRDFLIVPSESGRGDPLLPGPWWRPSGSSPRSSWWTSPTRPPHGPSRRSAFPKATSAPSGGRFGAHSVNESFYPAYYGKLAIFSWFNAGTRIFDIRDPFGVQEIGYFIPAPNKNTQSFCPDGVSHPDGDPKITAACVKVIQTNNIERG